MTAIVREVSEGAQSSKRSSKASAQLQTGEEHLCPPFQLKKPLMIIFSNLLPAKACRIHIGLGHHLRGNVMLTSPENAILNVRAVVSKKSGVPTFRTRVQMLDNSAPAKPIAASDSKNP